MDSVAIGSAELSAFQSIACDLQPLLQLTHELAFHSHHEKAWFTRSLVATHPEWLDFLLEEPQEDIASLAVLLDRFFRCYYVRPGTPNAQLSTKASLDLLKKLTALIVTNCLNAFDQVYLSCTRAPTRRLAPLAFLNNMPGLGSVPLIPDHLAQAIRRSVMKLISVFADIKPLQMKTNSRFLRTGTSECQWQPGQSMGCTDMLASALAAKYTMHLVPSLKLGWKTISHYLTARTCCNI